MGVVPHSSRQNTHDKIYNLVQAPVVLKLLQNPEGALGFLPNWAREPDDLYEF